MKENCYCCGCNRYWQGPPGKWPDEISLIRCDSCKKEDIKETGAYMVKTVWRTKRDGTKVKSKGVRYY